MFVTDSVVTGPAAQIAPIRTRRAEFPGELPRENVGEKKVPHTQQQIHGVISVGLVAISGN